MTMPVGPYALDEVHCVDCLEAMRELPDGCVDAVVTDPPYGIGRDGQKLSISKKNVSWSRKSHRFAGWDKAIPDRAVFEELFRVSRRQVLWGGNYFVQHLPGPSKGWLVWDKGQPGLSMSDCELAYTSLDRPTRIKVVNRVALLLEGALHPTQKPLEVMLWSVAACSEPGDVVLDPFAGSGTTLVAAKQLGRRFLGFEIEPRYVEIARQRLAQGALELAGDGDDG